MDNNYSDKQIKPDYYGKSWESYLLSTYTTEELMLIDEFNIKKYLHRYKQKNGVQDLKKALTYLAALIEKAEQLETNKIDKEIDQNRLDYM